MSGSAVDLVVVGAGIAGLTVAQEVARAGHRVVVLDAGEKPGGLLRARELAGVAIDVGAESFATRTSGVADLIAEAGLDLSIVSPATPGAVIAAVDDSDPRAGATILRAALPRATVLGIPSDPHADDVVRILGRAGAHRVAAEVIDGHAGDGPEPSLADLVAAQCGETLLRRLVDPLCRSVYSLPADRLLLSRVHPAMWREYRARGSLVAAAAAVAAPGRAGAAVAGIAGGMWRLADALGRAAGSEGAQLHGRTVVRSLASTPEGIEVHADGGTWSARRVVVATGPRAAAALLDPAAERAHDVAVRVVAARVDEPAFDAHPVGSGVIVAHEVPSAAKALTHVTAKWAWAAEAVPAGAHVFRLSLRDPGSGRLVDRDDIAREIALLTGVPVDPARVTEVTGAEWDDATGALAISDERREHWREAGVILAGAGVAGTGLASVVPHARGVAAELRALLAA
ncbi:protoporphyrinogen/coproporphyrinogen oxidase [Microbacterium sp. TNHR37B]|uniref:protoporphyrinogen/coproporphyrinogen oxidase n=1 Tax=Microbacterium sp. TNHR37B TaxID=1775956 RepID=UPI0007B1D0D9|nr:FAD-dependent oxidoreductase [Microbacterium sp. TNHR37B]KZE91426.1 Protoporphyrinogen oxidase [Microbacterium sp. TNHR37B]